MQTRTAASDGWTARVTSWRSIWPRWQMIFPAVHAPIPQRWHTAHPMYTMLSRREISVGKMPAGQKRSWRSTSPQLVIASVPCWRWSPPRWQHSTAAMTTTWNSSLAAKGLAHPTLSAQSSLLTCTIRLTFFLGSSAKETGAATTRPDPQTTGWSAPITLRMRTITNSLKKQESSSPL